MMRFVLEMGLLYLHGKTVIRSNAADETQTQTRPDQTRPEWTKEAGWRSRLWIKVVPLPALVYRYRCHSYNLPFFEATVDIMT
jgi:hypothetical protein